MTTNEQKVGKYQALDEAIVLQISVLKAATFTQINGGEPRKIADSLATKDRHGWPEGWRLIDRRLQALRKAGRITYSRKEGWKTP